MTPDAEHEYKATQEVYETHVILSLSLSLYIYFFQKHDNPLEKASANN